MATFWNSSPTVSVTPGPTWATMLNAILAQLPSHNHSTSGGEAQIPTAGLNINAAVPFNTFGMIGVGPVGFNSLASLPTLGANPNAVYTVAGNLYYETGAPNASTQIQITNSTGLVPPSQVSNLTVTGSLSVGGGASFTGGLVVGGGATSVLSLTGLTASFSGGVLVGSRHAGFKAFIAATELNGGASNVTFKNFMPATAPGVALGTPTLTQDVYVPAYAGSIAAVSLKVYTGTSAGGQVTIASTGATSNLSQVVTNTQANANFRTTFTPGTFTYTNAQNLGFTATSTAGWSQGANAGIELQVWFYE